MNEFSTAFAAFLRFDLRADGWVAYLVFVLASGAIGLAIVLLDACAVFLGHASYLTLTHGPRATPKAAVAWVVGSMIGSLLGMLARVFEPTPLAAVLAALTWRTLLVKLEKLASHQPPERT